MQIPLISTDVWLCGCILVRHLIHIFLNIFEMDQNIKKKHKILNAEKKKINGKIVSKLSSNVKKSTIHKNITPCIYISLYKELFQIKTCIKVERNISRNIKNIKLDIFWETMTPSTSKMKNAKCGYSHLPEYPYFIVYVYAI